MDLFQIADANKHTLEVRYTEVIETLPIPERIIVQVFADRIFNTSRIGTNVRPSVMSDLLANRKYQNIYEWSEELSQLSGRSQSEILAEKLGRYYTLRISFDEVFEWGRRFRYAALNIGGVGASNYGQFCIILRSDFSERCEKLAYLKGDSLNTYVDSASQVDIRAIQEDASPHTHRHLLAVLKHARNIVRTAEDDWADLLFANDDLIEAIFTDDVDASEIEEIRILDVEYKKLWDLAFESLGRKLQDAERALISDFVTIRRTEFEGRLKITRC